MSWIERVSKRRERRAAERAHARWSGPRTAFVLAGGGVLGAIQVGQLRALMEAGIEPDVIVGTSVGAINGSMLAADPTPGAIERLTDVWTNLRAEDIFPGSRVARVWNIVARGDHIHPNDGIRRLIDMLPVHTFEQLQIPFHACAAGLADGEERWFDSGPLSRAILASTALPGVFPPVSIDGKLYVDGGVVNNVPVARATELGARRIYVLTCGAPSTRPRDVRRPIDVLIQSFAHSRAVRTALDLDRLKNEAEFVILPTFDVGPIRYNDPSKSAELIERAYEISAQFLATPGEAQA